MNEYLDTLFTDEVKWLPKVTQLRNNIEMEKAMTTHSSTLAWKIPRVEEPGRLQSMESRRVGHDWSDLAAAADNSALSSKSS